MSKRKHYLSDLYYTPQLRVCEKLGYLILYTKMPLILLHKDQTATEHLAASFLSLLFLQDCTTTTTTTTTAATTTTTTAATTTDGSNTFSDDENVPWIIIAALLGTVFAGENQAYPKGLIFLTGSTRYSLP